MCKHGAANPTSPERSRRETRSPLLRPPPSSPARPGPRAPCTAAAPADPGGPSATAGAARSAPHGPGERPPGQSRLPRAAGPRTDPAPGSGTAGPPPLRRRPLTAAQPAAAPAPAQQPPDRSRHAGRYRSSAGRAPRAQPSPRPPGRLRTCQRERPLLRPRGQRPLAATASGALRLGPKNSMCLNTAIRDLERYQGTNGLGETTVWYMASPIPGTTSNNQDRAVELLSRRRISAAAPAKLAAPPPCY